MKPADKHKDGRMTIPAAFTSFIKPIGPRFRLALAVRAVNNAAPSIIDAIIAARYRQAAASHVGFGSIYFNAFLVEFERNGRR